jgi:hypothetical protein
LKKLIRLNYLDLLRGANVKKPKRKAAKQEMKNLFPAAKRRGGPSVAWKHRFVCLPYKDQGKIPTTDLEKDNLLKCGLGEKVIEFTDLDISADEFKQIILEEFPKLRDGAGYLFYKCKPNSRKLEPLSVAALSSPVMLKDRVGTARTYICPIQQDLDLTQVIDLPKGVCYAATCITVLY